MSDRPDLLAIIARLSWRPARTMPQIPHEYTVRHEAADPADYWALHRAIARYGVIERWHGGYMDGNTPIVRGRGRPGLYPGDGWRYWRWRRKAASSIAIGSRRLSACAAPA
jgi:hypothetical protein